MKKQTDINFNTLINEIEQITKINNSVANNILEPRNIDPKLKNIIDIVTIEQKIKPVGTYGYNIFQYPSDIDLFEKIRSDKPRDLFIKNIIDRIKNIIQSIILSDNIYFIEFKAGVDERFEIKDHKNIIDITKKIKQWYDDHLISKCEALNVIDLIKKYHELKKITNATQETERILNELSNTVREFKMLRWNVGEILNGVKKLRSHEHEDHTINLYDALNMSEVTKLDTLIWYENRYIEMTNYFYFELIDPLTEEIIIISKPFNNYIDSLKKDISKYAGCTYYPIDILKMLKRMFLLYSSIYKNNPEESLRNIMWEITNIVNDSPGALSQIKADFEALDTVLKVLNANNLKNICIMLNNMTKRFNNNIELELTNNFNATKNKLFIIYAEYQMHVNSKNNNEIQQSHSLFVKILDDFIKIWISELGKIINIKTKGLLDKTGIKMHPCG